MTMGDHRSASLWLAIGGGLLAGLSPAAAGPVTMLPALALLWRIADRPRLAAIWGLLAVLLSHRWLLALHPLTWMGVSALLSLPIAILIWLVCGLAAAVLLAIWSNAARWLVASQPGSREELSGMSMLILALIWGLIEVGLAGGPLFWIGVGGSVLPLDPALAGLSRWIGSGGLAVLLLAAGWGLDQLFRQRFALRRTVSWSVIWLMALLLAHLLGAAALFRPPVSRGDLSLAGWQPAIPTREKFASEQQRRLPQALQRALETARAFDAQALVAPEGTFPSGWTFASEDQPLPLLTGGFRRQDGQLRSSLLLISPDADQPEPLLDKHRLVPLGEALPPLPPGLAGGLSAVGGVMPGPASRLQTGFSDPAAVAICYEISDGRSMAKAIAEGGQWMLSIANLDPYPDLLQRQFLALAQLRAIETGRDLFSVANTGPTAVVHADGRVDQLLPSGEEGVAAADIQTRKALTGYVRWLDLPLRVLFGICLIQGLISRRSS